MKTDLNLRKDNYVRVTLFILINLMFLVSCEKQSLTDPAEESDFTMYGPDSIGLKCGNSNLLIDYQLINNLSSGELKAALGPLFEPYIEYGVITYKVRYYTLYKGKKIIVSGAVCLPDKPINHKTTVVMYNHGTRITEADQLPSGGMDVITLISASNGNISFAADYVGFCESSQYFHPYLINEASDVAIGNMMIAGREFLRKKGINPKPGLYMFGFSQGGLATMSAQRFIENNPYYKRQVKLLGVATGTGPYDLEKNGFISVIQSDNYSAPAYLLFAFIAYNNYYNLNVNMDIIFKNAYHNQFLDYVSQNETFGNINASLPSSINELMQDDFRNEFIEGNTVFNYFFEKNNSITGWVPKTPLRIYHSPADEIVPYANAQVAYNTFITAGAKNIELITLPPVDHISSAFMSFADMLTWFK